MSSHHIVREDQEPALLIADARVTPFEMVQQLLEWSPTVVVLEVALQEVLTWGIKIDVVVAPEPNIKKLAFALEAQIPVKFISSTNQDDGLATALYFLLAAKQSAVNILSAAPLPFFESFISLDMAVFQNGKRWVYVRNAHFEKWLTAGSALEVFADGTTNMAIAKNDGVLEVKRAKGFWVAEREG